MTVMERTAYPRFKRSLTAKDLAEVYTPTPQERFLAHRSTKGSLAEFGFLVLRVSAILKENASEVRMHSRASISQNHFLILHASLSQMSETL